jgi:hypothetical protein
MQSGENFFGFKIALSFGNLAVLAPQKERTAFLAPKRRVRSRNHDLTRPDMSLAMIRPKFDPNQRRFAEFIAICLH